VTWTLKDTYYLFNNFKNKPGQNSMLKHHLIKINL